MTRARHRRAATAGTARRAVLAVLLAGCFLAGALGQPVAAPKDSRPIAPQTAAVPVVPAETAAGMCQCIADLDRRHIRCLSSAPECQAACASTEYSFVPRAPSCPVTTR